MPDTKTQLLDAGERLFAEHGFAAASLRAITRAAGANLAAVNYHFNSKGALLQAVIHRRMGPLNRHRLELLKELEGRSGKNPVPLRKLVEAFVLPVIELNASSSEGVSFVKLLSRLYTEPGTDFQRLFGTEVREVADRFSAAFGRGLPVLSRKDVLWRMHFTVGALAHIIAAATVIRLTSGGLCDPDDVHCTGQQLVDFAVGGWRAPNSGCASRKGGARAGKLRGLP